ncbi:MAG TPA: fused MFS/spermidine synthase [Bryobacteraceae bacterium]|nr:fused MFS/spermidine synthase [Bryobacteraceae bacterium]
MLLYALTILVSAFLLFQVEPIIARIILPWFGGSAAVWSTCLLFFQSVLLLGYLYAHWLYGKLRPRAQILTHILLLAASLAMLPIWPAASWKPSGAEDPSLRILLLLAATVGLPFFLLSTTGPLLQAWYAGRYRGAMPYRLYALSNAGSMLALISYPVLLEPRLGARGQALAWSCAYGVFVVLCAATAWMGRGAAAPEPPAEPAPDTEKSWRTTFFWIALPACASILLLAITNHLTQNIAAIPFLWILPLSLYLLSFILSFENPRWYQRRMFLGLFAVAVGGMAYTLAPEFQNSPIKVMVPFFAAGLFICCMVCHGELARLKPHPSRLTFFYVMIALGGALGGVFVALIAPHVFSGFYELPAGLVACACVVLAVLRADPESGLGGSWIRPAPVGAALLTLAVAAYLGFIIHERRDDARVMVRNFYGGLRVLDQVAEQSDDPVRRLMHGTITHGEQYLNPAFQNRPTTYYGPNSGVGRAIRQDEESGPVRVGVIGLGTGTLAAYGRAGDYFRFYEINPLVVRLARSEFTFLKICRARLNVMLGDARLSLEREPPEHFNVLVVDAFSGDAIPVHLLTSEAFELYFRHLQPDGVLAVHVSNKHLNLIPVVRLVAASLAKEARLVDTGDEPNDVFGSTWMLVTSGAAFFDGPLMRSAAVAVPLPRDLRMWTDDYSNLFQILK